MRRRLSHIVLSLVLALMIVSTGAGITVVHCSHSGMTALAQMSLDSDDDACMPQSGCMQLTVLKLSPVSSLSVPAFDFSQTATALPAVPQALLALWQQAVGIDHRRPVVPFTIDKPPRSYLRLLRILII